MAELKTKKNNASVPKFIASVKDEQQQKDSKELIKIFKEVTKKPPKMWGTSIIGFGQYHYKSERSSQEGDWMLTGFSPRKGQISLYIMPGFKDYKELLKDLGKHKISGGCCLYIKKLEDVKIPILKKIIKKGYTDMDKRHNKK